MFYDVVNWWKISLQYCKNLLYVCEISNLKGAFTSTTKKYEKEKKNQ